MIGNKPLEENQERKEWVEKEQEMENSAGNEEEENMDDSINSMMEYEEGKDSFVQDADSFIQPSSKTRFTLRKRKRRGILGAAATVPPEDQTDTASVCSLELDTEPDTKKKKGLGKISSLSSMFSSVSTPLGKRVGKMGSALHKSLSSARLSPAGSMRTPSRASLARSASTVFGTEGSSSEGGGRTSPSSVSLCEGPTGWSSSPFRRSSVCLTSRSSSTSLTPYKAPGPTPGKSRPTRFWSEVYSTVVHKLSTQEIKLQEAVFEMFNGEEDMIEDMKLVRKTYADSLIHLNILTQDEEQLVFGPLSALTPVHQQFHAGLARAQCKDGFWFEIGPAVSKWIRTVETPYLNYCSNLIQAKAFLDKKQAEDKAFSDFLQRCLQSPFSRKLDLWSFLDVPRSRLVKYPLLLKQVLKYSEDADDIKTITESISQLEKILVKVDRGMAESRCASAVSGMEFLTAVPPDCVRQAREEVLSGVLRNSRGTKVMVYLLDTGLVVGRSVTRPGVGRVVQVFRDPIGLEQLMCQDLADGEAVKPGSFHRAFSNQGGSKNAFRVWSSGETSEEGESSEKSHTLVAPDEHIKRQWVTTILKTVAKVEQRPVISPNTSETDNVKSVLSPRQRSRLKNKLSSGAEILGSISNRSSGRLKQTTPKLISASRLLSPSSKTPTTPTGGRTGLFRKRNSPGVRTSTIRSPVIKSSLSQSALAHLQAGGVRKVRGKVGRRRSDFSTDQENRVASNIVMDSRDLARDKMVGRRVKSAAVLQALGKKRKPAEKRMLALIDENTRPMSKSMAQLSSRSPILAQMSPGSLLISSPRYLTRQAAKLSKSMNDLLQL